MMSGMAIDTICGTDTLVQKLYWNKLCTGGSTRVSPRNSAILHSSKKIPKKIKINLVLATDLCYFMYKKKQSIKLLYFMFCP